MEFLQNPQKPIGKRLTQDQIRLLESNFKTYQNPPTEQKLELARRLGVQPKQVAIWYQNRRARHKTQTIELEYQTIQQKLEFAMADKKRLEREVCTLRYELNKAQKQLSVALNSSSNQFSSAAVSEDDDFGSSSGSFGDDMHFDWDDAKRLYVEELYACLIGPQMPA